MGLSHSVAFVPLCVSVQDYIDRSGVEETLYVRKFDEAFFSD